MNYKPKYANHFGLCQHDTLFDEYEYIVNHKHVKATTILVLNRDGYIDYNNLVALSPKNFNQVHGNTLFGKDLADIHMKFLQTNPYG